MVKLNFISVIFLLFSFCVIGLAEGKPGVHKMLEKMHWSGQASWRIETGKQNIYIDPLQLSKNSAKADIIFITHSHGDHLSGKDIKLIATDSTILIGPKSCADKLNETGLSTIKLVSPGDTLNVSGLPVIAVPAYNVKKTQFHPKENKWVGYILDINGIKIYHSGDTERIPEMKTFDCDIALLPLGQTYTMHSVQEAAEAALDINPTIAIPMHYGMYEGKTEDAEKFRELLKGKIEVIIKNME